MSRLRLVNLAADPSAPAAGKIEVYGRTADKKLRTIDEDGFVREIGYAAFVNGNTSDAGPTAGADFYLAASAVPISLLKAGCVVTWQVSATKTAACTGTPAFNIRCGTAQSVADTALATATGVAQTAAVDTGIFNIECVIRALTSTGTIAWLMRLAHKNATTGFQNQVQDQIFNGTSSSFNFTTAGLFLGLSINPTATTANGVWTFQTISVRADNP